MQPIDEQLVQMCSSEIEDASIKYANGHATDFREVARIIIAALRAQADAQAVVLNFPTMLRKMWSGSEVQKWLDALPPLYTRPAPEAAQALSDEDILAIADRHHTNCNAGLIAFARAILTRASAAAFDDRTDTLRTALEIIAVGDAKNPRAAAERALVDAGVWTQGAATVAEPSEWKCVRRDTACRLADRIIDDYLLHYDFPTQGQSHMHDCITSVLTAAMTEAPKLAAQQQDEPVGDERAALELWRKYACQGEKLESTPYHAARAAMGTNTEVQDKGLYLAIQAYLRAAQSGHRAGVAEGWCFYSADFSMNASNPANWGTVMLTRDDAGRKWWHALSDEEREKIDLFVSGRGTTFDAAMKAANEKAAIAAQSGQRAGVAYSREVVERMLSEAWDWGYGNMTTYNDVDVTPEGDKVRLRAEAIASVIAAAPTPAAQGGKS